MSSLFYQTDFLQRAKKNGKRSKKYEHFCNFRNHKRISILTQRNWESYNKDVDCDFQER